MKDQRFWDGYFAVVAGAVATAVLFAWQPRDTPVAEGVIAVMAGLYWFAGRKLVRGRPGGDWYVYATLTAFAVGTFALSTVSYLLFALCPLLFMILPVTRAVGAVLVANTAPIFAGFLRGGGDWTFVAMNGPIFAMTATVAVGMGLFITRIIIQSEERAALIAELETSRAEVSRLSHEAGAAAERARLAGEIHDTLAQGFTSIITLLQAADPHLTDDRLRLAVDTAKENLAESRALVAALTPSALGTGSLPEAVRRQATRTPQPATFRCTGTHRALPTAVEVVLLRTAQEALTNARRHAAAAQVTVVLAYTEEQVRLSVQDDGAGFAAGSSRGFGLTGMQARADQVGGELTVRSVPGRGVTVELEIPG